MGVAAWRVEPDGRSGRAAPDRLGEHQTRVRPVRKRGGASSARCAAATAGNHEAWIARRARQLAGGIRTRAGTDVGGAAARKRPPAAAVERRDQIPENRGNPLPLLLPAIDLLEAEGQGEVAQRIFAAAGRVLTERRALTPDLGGQATTSEMAAAIIAALP